MKAPKKAPEAYPDFYEYDPYTALALAVVERALLDRQELDDAGENWRDRTGHQAGKMTILDAQTCRWFIDMGGAKGWLEAFGIDSQWALKILRERIRDGRPPRRRGFQVRPVGGIRYAY